MVSNKYRHIKYLGKCNKPVVQVFVTTLRHGYEAGKFNVFLHWSEIHCLLAKTHFLDVNNDNKYYNCNKYRWGYGFSTHLTGGWEVVVGAAMEVHCRAQTIS